MSRRLLPCAVRRVLAGSAGLSMLVAPVAAGAAPQPVHAGRASGPVAAALPSPSWPVEHPGHTTVPAPRWPATPPAERPARTSSPQDTIRVHAGDSLWAIAARRLGPRAAPARLAAEWPRWYSANRAVIGANPDLIRPGQVLHAPQDQS